MKVENGLAGLLVLDRLAISDKRQSFLAARRGRPTGPWRYEKVKCKIRPEVSITVCFIIIRLK